MAATILVAEDSMVIRAVLRRHLEGEGYTVVEASDGQEAIDRSTESPPDVILLDIEMPGLNGHQVLAHLKADPVLQDIPVVFLTGRTDTDDIVAGLRSGAHDYLKKPFATAELVARVGAAVRMKQLQDELKRRGAEFAEMSRTDPLTGLHNRRHLQEQLRQLGSAARRHDRPLAVIMLDIDHFKSVNDTLGHDGGDAVLQEFARRVSSVARHEDVVGRWGGEEFLLMLPETDIAGTIRLAERVRYAVAETAFRLGDRELAVTVSAGCVCGPADDTDELVRQADGAMYEAKTSGRNRVVAYREEPAGMTP
jgi:two-component system, cell cycle response regulator